MISVTRALALLERLVVAAEKIATELHQANETLVDLAFDPNGETVLDRIYTTLHDNLQTFDREDVENAGSLAAHIARIQRGS